MPIQKWWKNYNTLALSYLVGAAVGLTFDPKTVTLVNFGIASAVFFIAAFIAVWRTR